MRASQPRSFRHLPVLCVAAFLAILPILVRGPSCGHDFDFHILSWLEAANQFAHFGYPHWAYTPAYNAGEPRFVFYPPLSWTLGAILGLILPWNLVPAAFTWVALTFSGLTMHRLASRYASPAAALIAATLYLANPYMLFTAYERTAYGELLAAAWLPLLFAAIFAERIRILQVAIPLALLWLTNAPAAVMGSYALAFLVFVRLIRPFDPADSGFSFTYTSPARTTALSPANSGRLRMALTTAAGTALGLTLTGFYLVPAMYEQRFVKINMAVIPGMRPQEHFLFHRMGTNSFDDLFHDQVVRTASIIALILLVAILFLFLTTKFRPSGAPCSTASSSTMGLFQSSSTPERQLVFPLLLLTLLVAFLLTPPSLLLWNHIPKLAFLQFPWRLCALLAVIFATLTATALNRVIRPRARPAGYESMVPGAITLALTALLVFPAWHLFHQPCDPEDTVPARVALFHSNRGTDATDEYTPIDADGDALKPGDPPLWKGPPNTPDAQPPANASPGGLEPELHWHWDMVSQPGEAILNRRAYPGWQLRVAGHEVQTFPSPRADGLIVFNYPAGEFYITLRAVDPPDRWAGEGISLASLLTAVFLCRRRRPVA